MNLKRRTRKNKIKINGGALTGNQIFDLYATFLPDFNNFNNLAIDNIKPLNFDKDLYNDKCHVFYIDNSNYKSDLYKIYNIRFIIVHQGTRPQIRDWGNNVRNLIMGRFNMKGRIYDKLTTSRNLIARRGHERLKTWIKDLYKNQKNKEYGAIIKTINNIIGNYKKDFQDSNINIDKVIDELLLNTLTTIGHSQGAVYAYLYGNQGKETIVINPAPYNNKKPDNIYIIRRKGDPVSIFTSYDNNIAEDRIITLPKKRSGVTHKISTLYGNPRPFGNMFLYNKEPNLNENNKLHSYTNKTSRKPIK